MANSNTFLHIPHKNSAQPNDLAANWTTLQNFVNQTPWIDYSCTWNGTIVNGVLLSRYRTYGKTCFVRIYLLIGSSDTGPPGQWTLTVPFTAPADSVLGASAHPQRFEGQVVWPGHGIEEAYGEIIGESNTILMFSVPIGTTAGYVPLTGTTGIAGDVVVLEGVYETT